MTHSLRTRSLAALSLAVASVGLIALACGSDKKDTATENPPLTPGGGTQTNTAGSTGNGTTITPAQPANPAMPGNANPTPGNEGPMGNIPVEQPNGMNPGGMNPDMPGNNPPVTNPPNTPVAVTQNCSAPEGAVPNLTVQQVGTFAQPLYVTGAPGDDRLFVVEKGGNVRTVLNGQVQQTPFITQQVTNGGERGLLGLAFHPDFQTNGLFYLHFSSPGGGDLGAAGTTVIAEYQAPGDHSVGDPATRRVVLTIADPTEANHNGGQILFGSDKLLYIGMGDGGGGNDNSASHGPIGNGQNVNTLLGKILRIDPLGRAVNGAYSNPPQNLGDVTGQQARGEVWAYGLRNPWRFNFDPCTGDLYIGDVGQDTQEEIDYVAAPADTKRVAAGLNFGWRITEASICRPGGTEACNAQVQASLTGPVDFYPTAAGGQRGSVTGGYVYRGSAIPGLRGTYIYADYARGIFTRFKMQNGQMTEKLDITQQLRSGANFAGNSISSFGMDNSGEMYIASFAPAGVFRIVAAQ